MGQWRVAMGGSPIPPSPWGVFRDGLSQRDLVPCAGMINHCRRWPRAGQCVYHRLCRAVTPVPLRLPNEFTPNMGCKQEPVLKPECALAPVTEYFLRT